jgi:adenylosuccinate synthase
VLHTIPSGVFRPDTLNVVGNGVVIDPIIFKKEIDALVGLGVDVVGSLAISRKAHLILPTHRLLDAASEAAKGKAKIGSTLKGIGPTYMDKTGRNGLRVGDIESPHFESRYHTLRDKHVGMLGQFDGFEFSVDDAEWLEAVAFLQTLKLIDSEHDMNRALKAGQRILAEGAQGTMLDIDFGTYPFVTSSNTISAGACTGLGIAPNRVGEVFGIFKAYCTRVGSGPFPTELHDEVGEQMRAEGREFGATTGRPRRCGWLDLPQLRYAVDVNGATQLCMMKADVLGCFEEIEVCTHYIHRDEKIDHLPFGINPDEVEPVYTTLPGWPGDLTGIRTLDEVPQTLLDYVAFIEEAVGVPVTVLSVGPDRAQTLQLKS